MSAIPPDLIAEIRSSSRMLVRELGFMNRTLAGTDLPPSAVHVIIEIGASGRLSAKELSETLLLEKSTVSRLVQSLIARGEVGETRSMEDGRRKVLTLTGEGEKALAAIARFGERQVAAAIGPLNPRSREKIRTGLETYAAALKQSRTSDNDVTTADPVTIEEGYTPCLVGRVVEMHASYYARHVGFGAAFEAKVAGELGEFVTRLDRDANAIWTAKKSERIVGGIVIDGECLGSRRAHLRWFIVDDGIRGGGVGNALIGKAMTFCDRRGFREIHLWTFKGLDAARRLYEKHDFVLAEEELGDQWGTEVLEQKFVRRKP